MPIDFVCPHCGLKTNVADQYAGHSGPCAGCGKTITVPSLARDAPYTPPAKPSAGPMVVVVIVVLALLVILACGGFFFYASLSAVPAAREAARRSQCSASLRQIGLAMHNYHDVYGCFPPAYVPDEEGRPMHSWRVLLLPFLGGQFIYDQYDFEQPWDSPANLPLASAMPNVYCCPSDSMSLNSETSYAMIVGAGTISDGSSVTEIKDILDGTSNTILVVEAAGSNINWLEPRDLDAEQISFLVNDPVDGGIRSEHPGGAHALFCDGSILFLDASVDPEVVRNMGTIAGGEAVDRSSVGY
jgi:prepilin-type processing-associated H-X9-DG protein